MFSRLLTTMNAMIILETGKTFCIQTCNRQNEIKMLLVSICGFQGVLKVKVSHCAVRKTSMCQALKTSTESLRILKGELIFNVSLWWCKITCAVTELTVGNRDQRTMRGSQHPSPQPGQATPQWTPPLRNPALPPSTHRVCTVPASCLQEELWHPCRLHSSCPSGLGARGAPCSW